MSREMKNSGIPWIGDIPKDWGINLLSSLFDEHKQKNKDLAETNLLSLSYGRIIRKDINTKEGLLPESFDGYNIISAGDIVFRLTDLQNDKRSLRTGLCIENGIITSAYVTIRGRQALNSAYYHYLFHSYDLCKVFYGMGEGVRQGMNYGDLRKLLILLPSIEEQQKIASFLDGKCSEIDEMIVLQEKIVEELKAYKQSVITETVTKGLNPDVPMKDSGIEWIGEIPEHWRITTVGRLFRVSAGGDAKWDIYSDKQDNEHPFPVYTNTLDKNQTYAYTSIPVYKGDTITVTGRGDIGRAFYRKTPFDAIIRLLVLEKRYSLDCRYFAYFINNVIHFFTNSAAIGQLSAIQVVPYNVCHPSIEEQTDIADYLDTKCTEIDNLISIKLSKIDSLKEYKKSIIYEYVTGKKEVIE